MRPFSIIQSADQWLRASHEMTALRQEGEAGVVQLFWKDEPPLEEALGPAPPPSGMAFDAWCRLYRSLPEEGIVQRIKRSSFDPLQPVDDDAETSLLFESTLPPQPGQFHVADEPEGLKLPTGLAVDPMNHLFVAERGAARILIVDLVEARLLRRLSLFDSEGRPWRPVDLAASGAEVIALMENPSGLLRIGARRQPTPVDLPEEIADPQALAVTPDGRIFLLVDRGAPTARIVARDDPGLQIDLPGCTDFLFVEGEGDEVILIAARLPGQDFTRHSLRGDDISSLPRLKAKDYDGRGIVVTPSGGIGFCTPRGFRIAVEARLRFESSGLVTSFRLDSGQYRNVWGRLFLDACVPRTTSVQVRFITADEPPEDPSIPRLPPENFQLLNIRRPDLSPPMPPASLMGVATAPGRLHRRETGDELPWHRRDQDDPFVTYEMPVSAPPGRFLWVQLLLSGNTRFTPRVRSIRVEHSAHALLKRLPRIFSREASATDFLRRYLAIPDGLLQHLEALADARRVLLDPRSTPAEALPWLAGFMGLLLDERWSESSRRQLIEEASWLFRFRGTLKGLSRFLEIYLGRPPLIIEHFRLRGLGGGVLAGAGAGASNSILGGGFRVGGAVGDDDELLDIEGGSAEEVFRTHAHRFTILVPSLLNSERRGAVEHILEMHRPAHTVFNMCTVEAGMRLGLGLLLELTSVVGPGAAFRPLQLGRGLLGREGILGLGRGDQAARPLPRLLSASSVFSSRISPRPCPTHSAASDG